MSVIIGHASIDENGKAANGKAGDQTGKEVCTRSWYNKSWSYMLRCNNTELAEKMANACEQACKNNNIGYDQNQRNTLKKQASLNNYNLSAITVPCECDCSSLMTVCAECAGILVPYNGSNAPTTRTMKKAFASTGFFNVYVGNEYLSKPDLLKRGDILVKEGAHTVMILSNDKYIQSDNNTKSIEAIALEVINNLWGNGTTRKLRLEQAGYNYNEVQNKVNEILKG